VFSHYDLAPTRSKITTLNLIKQITCGRGKLRRNNEIKRNPFERKLLGCVEVRKWMENGN
jgi:hypothetical protein